MGGDNLGFGQSFRGEGNSFMLLVHATKSYNGLASLTVKCHYIIVNKNNDNSEGISDKDYSCRQTDRSLSIAPHGALRVIQH